MNVDVAALWEASSAIVLGIGFVAIVLAVTLLLTVRTHDT